MKKPPLNIGMIGAGFIGQLAHLMNYVEVAECRVLALAEYRPELRRLVANRYAIPHACASHHELLENPAVDAVVVVTPRPYTALIAGDCLRAGKHVMTEKPMAGTALQAQPLVDLAAASGLHYAVGYMKRYDEGVQMAKRILDGLLTTGELGPVLFVRAHCYMGNSYCRADGHVVTDEKADYADPGLPVSPDWLPGHLSKPYARFVNCFSHNTNLLRFLFGRTPAVEYSHVSSSGGQVAVLSFGDFRATLETGDATNRGWDEVTEIYFADGRLTIRTPPALLKNVPASVELYRAGTRQLVETPLCDWTWSFRRQAEAFVRDVREGRQSISPGADAIEDLHTMENIWRADQRRISSEGADRTDTC